MMIKSGQPRKQRKFRFNAPHHDSQKFVHAHISDELAKKLGLKTRALAVRKGDTVKVQVGTYRGKVGKVSMVNIRTGRVTLDGMNRKNAKGKELPVSIYSSNVYLVDLDLSDRMRVAKIEQLNGGKVKVQVAPKQALPAKAETPAAKPAQAEKEVPKAAAVATAEVKK